MVIDRKTYFTWGQAAYHKGGGQCVLTQYVAPLLIPGVKAALIPTPSNLGMKGDYLALEIPETDLLVYPTWSYSYDTRSLTVEDEEIGRGMWSARIVFKDTSGDLLLEVNNCERYMARRFNLTPSDIVINMERP
jgi:hypothetical protein